VAIARPVDNANGGNSEFFINMADNSDIFGPGGATPDGYTVFGVVVGKQSQEFLKRCESE
jgi:cyclophilin family peptidyl-prolyl cis-trans isomerase